MITILSQNRGQTLPDYVVAFGIFFLAISLAFGSTYSLFTPFESTYERVGEGDRVANTLVQTTFTEQGTRHYVLDADCTASAVNAFNGNSTQTYKKCNYDSSTITSVTHEKYIGLEKGTNIHVEIVDSSGNIATVNSTDLVFGDNVPTTANTSNSVRMVDINGDLYKLRVTVW